MVGLELEGGASTLPGLGQDQGPLPSGVGILLHNPVMQRLIESAAAQLELSSKLLTETAIKVKIDEPAALKLEDLDRFELLVADEPAARTIRLLFSNRRDKPEAVNPAVIAVLPRSGETALPEFKLEQEFDGVLALPQEPATLLTQLSIILYAHRAFVRRFQSAMEELHLNRRIFRSVSSGISVARADLTDQPLIYVNPAFEVMTGYTFEEAQGKNCRFLQGEERDQPGLTIIREALAARREVTAILRNYRKDGTFFWNELSLSPIRNRDGQVTHIVGIQNDVTARIEFEAALRESEKLAAVGRLAASIAHEINNPLEAVTNLLYLARHDLEVPRIRGYLELADKELHRVSLITSQSLRFYRQSTKPQAVRPADILESVLDLYHGKIDNARVHVECRQRMTESIVCLESEVRQVISNLIRNALDAMAGMGGRLLVRSRETTDWPSGARGALITVADTGTGISPDTMKNLFKAFFTTKGVSGTGLGLWVSSEIIKRHHGRLLVRSSQVPGASYTVFELFLPYQKFAT